MIGRLDPGDDDKIASPVNCSLSPLIFYSIALCTILKYRNIVRGGVDTGVTSKGIRSHKVYELASYFLEIRLNQSNE